MRHVWRRERVEKQRCCVKRERRKTYFEKWVKGLMSGLRSSLTAIGLKIYHKNGGMPGEQRIKFSAHSIAFSIAKEAQKVPT